MHMLRRRKRCDTCITTEAILTEVSSVSNNVSLEIIDFYNNEQASRELKIKLIVAVSSTANFLVLLVVSA